jgi:hypothetical protein
MSFFVVSGINFLFFKKNRDRWRWRRHLFFHKWLRYSASTYSIFFWLMPMDGGICFLLCSTGGVSRVFEKNPALPLAALPSHLSSSHGRLIIDPLLKVALYTFRDLWLLQHKCPHLDIFLIAPSL